MSKAMNLAETRTIQDWNLRFALAKAEGVAEVASVGGFVRQYNVVLDPQRMRDLGITMQRVRDAIRASNADVGGRTVELSEFEYVVRGRGYLKGTDDIGSIVLKTDKGTPVLVRDIARVELGPDERRGITELNGEGEVASGIILQRFGMNALDVIGYDRVPATPTVTLKVNGQHPTPPVVTTTGPMVLTLDISASSFTAPVSWFWGLVVNNQVLWVTPAGLSTTPAPLAVAPPVAISNATLLNVMLPPGAQVTTFFALVDGTGSVVAIDAIEAVRP